MKTIRFWFKNARYQSLPQSVLPAILAVCLASGMSGFSLSLGLLAILGVIFGHLGVNLFDDYFDYRIKGSKFRDSMAREGIRARIAKCSYITSGEANLKQLLIACLAFGMVALIIETVIFIYRGQTILYLALITGILGISYSGAPLKLSYRGLGELQIGLMFGPLLMSGVYFSACGVVDWKILLISIPVGLLVANIVYTHSIMDFEPDKRIGKMTFAVLLGNKKRMLTVLLLLLVLSFGFVIFGVAKGFLSPFFLLVLLTLPMAVSLYHMMSQFIKDPQKSFSPKIWMGPMGNWENYKTIGIDWFMIRWLLARNLLSFFCLIIIVVSFIS